MFKRKKDKFREDIILGVSAILFMLILTVIGSIRDSKS